LATYDAIPIQADPALANGHVVTTNADGALLFDGAPGDYLAVTGQVLADVRYTALPPVATGPTFTLGVLTLLTYSGQAIGAARVNRHGGADKGRLDRRPAPRLSPTILMRFGKPDSAPCWSPVF
jgi:hypothetical protein